MWFTRFGEYINRGWKESATVALIFSLIPLMGWVSVVILALITLRKGPRPGLIILLVTALPSLLFLSAGFGYLWVAILISGNLLAWCLAIVLRETSDWGKVLFTALLLVLVVSTVLHLLVPDLQSHWVSVLQKAYLAANKDTEMLLKAPSVNIQQDLLNMARVMLPTLFLTQVLLALTNLLIARWWQANLFNPGGFVGELHQVRLNIWCSMILLAVVAAIYMGVSAAWDVLPTAMLMFFLVGVVVFHNLIAIWKAKTSFIWLFYGLVVLLFPYSLVLVAGFGIADSFVDFRARIARSTKNGEK